MVICDQAYLLHARPYAESSVIAQLLTADNGVVSVIVRGVQSKTRKAQNLRASLQMGNRLALQWLPQRIAGSGLKTITDVTVVDVFTIHSNRQFLCVAYVAELLLRVLPQEEPLPEIFALYQHTLAALSVQNAELELPLRQFEFALLDLLGVGIDFNWDADADTELAADAYYHMVAEKGLQRCDVSHPRALSTAMCESLAQRDFSAKEVLRMAKKVSRYQLDKLLDGRALKTRQLYQDMLS